MTASAFACLSRFPISFWTMTAGSTSSEPTTVGQLYNTLAGALRSFVDAHGEAALFVGDPGQQVANALAPLPGVCTVTDLASALAGLRIIVTQGDTEPASVEQQRLLGNSAPSQYDARNLFQVNVEEGRHLWAMAYLLHCYFGRDGREEAEELLERRSGDLDRPRILTTFNEPIEDWLSFFMFTMFTDRDGKYQLLALAESGFDLKFLTRAIVLSRAYKRTSRPGGDPERQAALFGRMSVKVLSAGQLYDSLVTVLGPPARTTGVDPRAGARFEFTQFFGEEGDSNPTAYRRGIPHLLRQMNSDQFAGRNVVALAARLAKQDRSADDVAGDLFLTILSRRPTADEQKLFRAHVTRAGSLQTAARELAWALLMSSEFALNH